MFTAIRYEPGCLYLLDQRLLPHESTWHEYRELAAIAEAIELMVVRGAPAIGCTAAFALAVDAWRENDSETWSGYRKRFAENCERLRLTRPTAVNLFLALRDMSTLAETFDDSFAIERIRASLDVRAQQLFAEDLATCQAIGHAGAAMFTSPVNVYTHCNTGSLATAGYGTALGVIRSLKSKDCLAHVYAGETRPYLQGARLTVYELQQDDIPVTLVVDAAAAYLMREGKIDMVVVGADRIAANGDAANKIGTYSLAVNAAYHRIPFFVAAPKTTFDPSIKTGRDIPIELRHAREITHYRETAIAPVGVEALNPSFDVTPHELISGIITEAGVLRPPFDSAIAGLLDGRAT